MTDKGMTEKLSTEESNILLQKLEKNYTTDEPMCLADIYNIDVEVYKTEDKTTKIGLFSRMANGFITSLLTDFASRCQLESLVFDEDDCCHLLIDQNTAITIRAQEDRLTLIGLISGDKPSDDTLHQHMKDALTQGSPAVFWEAETDIVGVEF